MSSRKPFRGLGLARPLHSWSPAPASKRTLRAPAASRSCSAHAPSVPAWIIRQHATYNYLMCVNRAEDICDRFRPYPRQLRQHLSPICVPVADGDPDMVLDVQTVLAQTYEAGSYRTKSAGRREAVRVRASRCCVPVASAGRRRSIPRSPDPHTSAGPGPGWSGGWARAAHPWVVSPPPSIATAATFARQL